MSHTSLCREDARFYSTVLRLRTSVFKVDLGQQSVQMTIFLLRFLLMQKRRSHLVSCKRTTVLLYTPLGKSKGGLLRDEDGYRVAAAAPFDASVAR